MLGCVFGFSVRYYCALHDFIGMVEGFVRYLCGSSFDFGFVCVIFEWVIELVFGCVILGRGTRLAKLWKTWLRYICSAQGRVVVRRLG